MNTEKEQNQKCVVWLRNRWILSKWLTVMCKHGEQVIVRCIPRNTDWSTTFDCDISWLWNTRLKNATSGEFRSMKSRILCRLLCSRGSRCRWLAMGLSLTAVRSLRRIRRCNRKCDMLSLTNYELQKVRISEKVVISIQNDFPPFGCTLRRVWLCLLAHPRASWHRRWQRQPGYWWRAINETAEEGMQLTHPSVP